MLNRMLVGWANLRHGVSKNVFSTLDYHA